MATRIYSHDLGNDEYEVTDAAGSATTKGMELTIDLAKILTREDALLGLEHIRNYILRGLWPPA